MLSYLATGTLHGEIKGLKAFPPSVRPPVTVTHLAFQTMVALGMGMMGVSGLALLLLDAPQIKALAATIYDASHHSEPVWPSRDRGGMDYYRSRAAAMDR